MLVLCGFEPLFPAPTDGKLELHHVILRFVNDIKAVRDRNRVICATSDLGNSLAHHNCPQMPLRSNSHTVVSNHGKDAYVSDRKSGHCSFLKWFFTGDQPMKLKTLLLGSAAAMIAVSGARAADAVVADPEPVEYVRVCDMYGNGFFYIPGTETCLNINGYVRIDYTHRNDRPVDGTYSNDWDYRVRLNFDARNETDYGTLRSQIRLQSDGDGTGDGLVGIDRALISLAGFRLGYSDSYTTTLHGYGLPVEKYDGYYGYDQAIFFDYTYAANGFSATVGVQNSIANDAANFNEQDFDYYVGASYSGSWGTVAASYIFEERVDDGAYKLSATITAIENLTIKGFFVGDGGDNTAAVNGAGDYAWGVGANYNVTDTFALRAGYSENEDANSEFFVVGARWNPVPGLSIRPEAAFFDDGEEYSVRVYRTF